MPVSIRVDTEEDVVYTTVTGLYTADDVLKAIDELFEHPDFRPGLNGITDLRGAETFPPYTDVIRIAQYLVRNRDRIGRSRTAVLVSSDVSFGTTRMFQTYSDDSSIETHIFHELDEARRWLGLDE
jgi:hypothetical protein